MLIEQAIYTSSQNHQRGGYQLAACSAGVSNDDARDLSRWGPAHDSLADVTNWQGSLNFHRLPSGAFCVSKTVPSGCEYSQRTGPRIFTHQFIVPEQVMRRFSRDPLRLMDALVARGHLDEAEDLPEHLPSLRLVGGATACDCSAVRRLLSAVGLERVCQLVAAVLANPLIGIKSDVRPDHLVRALISLLPVPVRPSISFSTGLRTSARRPYRVQVLPNDERLARQEARRVRMLVYDLHARNANNTKDPWCDLLAVALQEPTVDLPLLIRLAADCDSDDLAEIAEFVTSRAR